MCDISACQDVVWANENLGCPLIQQMEYLLEAMRPYPGDPNWEDREQCRFTVYKISDKRLCILDNVTGNQEVIPNNSIPVVGSLICHR